MATKLFLRNTTTNGISNYFDMVTTAGASGQNVNVNTAASGTQIQWTDTAGGTAIAWISGRVPAGGFTLTTTDISVWCLESNMNANCGGRYRVFKRAANGTETELGGGPFDDGVEFGTGNTEMTWTGNVTDTAFAEDDRILIKIYITNIGTMASGFTCTLNFNAADAATGDSFFNIAETVSFKPEAQTYNDSRTEASSAADSSSAQLIAAASITETSNAQTTQTYPNTFNDSVSETVARTNLVLQSNTFTNASWTKTNASVTGGFSGDPLGGSNATKLVEDSTATSGHLITQSVTVAFPFTDSIWLKPAERTWARVSISLADFAFFDLSSGAVGQKGTNTVASITADVNGWWKCKVTSDTSGSFAAMTVYTATGDGVNIYSGDGTSGIFVFGAQVEVGTQATHYIPTTTAAVSEGAYDLESGIVPQIGTTLEPVEPYNFLLQSGDISDGSWTKNNATVTTNAIANPLNGAVDADLLTEDSSNGIHRISQGPSGNGLPPQSTRVVVSGYAKANGRTWIHVQPCLGTNVYFNLSGSGSIGTETNAFDRSIMALANGWYRCQVVTDVYSSFSPSAVVGLASADNVNSYTGNGTSGAYIWGFQAQISGVLDAPYSPTTTVPTYIPSADSSDGTIPSSSASITEAASGADTQTSVANFTAARVEASTGSDAETSAAVFVGSDTEPSSAADTSTGAWITPASRTEAGSASEAETATQVFPVSESNATSSGASAQDATFVYPVTRTETNSAADSSTAANAQSDSRTEASTAADTETVQFTAQGTLTEASSALDTVNGIATMAVSQTESSSAADTTTGVRTIADSRTEASTATDTESVVATFTTTITEASTGNSTQVSVAVFVSDRTEASSAADSTNSAAVFTGSDSEPSNAQDSIIAGWVVSISEPSSASEAASALMVATATRTEPSTGLDSQSASAVFVSDRTEASAAAHTQTAVALFIGSLSETANAQDTANGIANFTAAISEPSLGADLALAIATFVGSRTEASTGTDSASAIKLFISAATETGNAQGVQSTQAIFQGLIEESGLVQDFPNSNAVMVAALLEPSDGNSLEVGEAILAADISEILDAEDLQSAVQVLIKLFMRVSLSDSKKFSASLSDAQVYNAKLRDH